MALMYTFYYILIKLIKPRFYIFAGVMTLGLVFALISFLPNTSVFSIFYFALGVAGVGLLIARRDKQ